MISECFRLVSSVLECFRPLSNVFESLRALLSVIERFLANRFKTLSNDFDGPRAFLRIFDLCEMFSIVSRRFRSSSNVFGRTRADGAIALSFRDSESS